MPSLVETAVDRDWALSGNRKTSSQDRDVLEPPGPWPAAVHNREVALLRKQ